MRRYTPVLATAALLLTVGCESEERLKRTEQELSELKVEVFKLRRGMEDSTAKNDAERGAAAEARSQDQRFRADLQETLRQIQDTTRALKNSVNELPRRASKPTPAASESSTPTLVGEDDEKAYGAAMLDYNRGHYAIAAESIQLFLKTYPSSAKRPDAIFFLGLCHYNQKVYDKAQSAFEQIIREHATSTQYLPAKLKRAQSLLKLGLKPSAIQGFRELVNGFPTTSEARIAKQELEDLGL